MCHCPTGVVEARTPAPDVLSAERWQPAKRENIRKMACTDRPAEALATLRAQEQELAALIARMSRGDQTALAALYDRTNSLVYGLALRVLQEPAAAEDITIEVYTQVYRQASIYDPSRGTPSAWLLMLTRSRAIDRLRMETQRREREEPLEAAAVAVAPAADPEACSAVTELQRIVRRALATLTPEQRQVIEIAYYSGLSHSEIAARLGLPLGTVKTRIRTGMMLLREHLHPLLAKEPL
jgi:RNA polymerase sigma-70 factor (ECF subfamily)